jgi:hypothetical protein
MTMLKRSAAGIAALEARYWAAVWAERIGNERRAKEAILMNGTNGTTKREKIEFAPNEPQRVALKYATPKIGMNAQGNEYALYTTVDDRVFFLPPQDTACITSLGIRPGEFVNLMLKWSGKRGDPKIYHAWLDRETEVNRAREEHPEGRYGAQRNGTFAVPAAQAPPPTTAPAPGQITGDESDLEYELRMSVEMERIKQALADRKKRTGAGSTPTPAPAPSTAAKTPSQVNGHHTPAPGPQPPAPGQYNGRGEDWQTCTLAMAKELVAIYADALAWAREEYGVTHTITGEDVRQLVSGAHIRVSRG